MVVVDIRPNAPTLNCCWFDANLHMQTAYVDARLSLEKEETLKPPARCLQASRPCVRTEHRAERLSMSLDVSGPHRMMSGASAIGALWPHW